MTLVCQFERTCLKAENPPFPDSLLLTINLQSFIFILILKISKRKKKGKSFIFILMGTKMGVDLQASLEKKLST